MLSKTEFEQTIKFVFSREQPEGGFSFAGEMPPALEDTYYAIRTLSLIERELSRRIPIRKETVEYIRATDEDDMADYRLRYQSFWLCQYFNIKPGVQRRESFVFSERGPEQFYYYLLLDRNLGEADFLGKTLDEFEYVSEIAYLVLIKKKLRIKFDQKEYAKKIQSIQNPDGGFGFNQGSTSFLENTYLAVKALAAMDQKPLYLKECISLIEGCRANNGGYGRSTSTVPSLETTYYAIKCLKILD